MRQDNEGSKIQQPAGQAPIPLHAPHARKRQRRGSVAMVLAAVGVRGWMTIFYPSALTWIAAAAFGSAAGLPWKTTPSWWSPLALMLNLASILVFCGFALVSATHADIMLFGLPVAAAGAAPSGWNLAHLSA